MEEEKLDDKEPKLREPLPDIPDYPDAPLPAWKHYGITKYASDRVVKELEGQHYEGYMVGLDLKYSLDKEHSYSMGFGKVDIPDTTQEEEKEEPELPVSDEFLVDLYQTANALIAKNVPGGLKDFDSELTVALTGSLKVVKLACTVPDRCNRGHINRRCCRKVNSGPWRCLHDRC